MLENQKTQNKQKNIKNCARNKQKSKISAEKSKYFEFYDDIKSGSNKVIDW